MEKINNEQNTTMRFKNESWIKNTNVYLFMYLTSNGLQHTYYNSFVTYMYMKITNVPHE